MVLFGAGREERRVTRAEATTRPSYQMAEPERALVARATAGDEAAYEVIMRQHSQLLFRTARSILASDADAEEAVQDAFLRAWRALATFRGESKLSTWLVRIARNEALARLRRNRPHTLPLEDAMISPDPEVQLALADSPDRGPEFQAFSSEVRQLIEDQIDELPEAFRTVFVLSALEGLSAREIAAVLDISVVTVRTRAFRARGLLRQGLLGRVDTDLSDAFGFDGARCDRIVANVLRRRRGEGDPEV